MRFFAGLSRKLPPPGRPQNVSFLAATHGPLLLDLARRYGVSFEAMCIRVLKLIAERP
jgi:hypothetical protein